MSGLPIVILYIDPGIGFVILQFLAASVLGIAFYFRKTTRQVLDSLKFFSRRKNDSGSD
jgi:hypothetical protein